MDQSDLLTSGTLELTVGQRGPRSKSKHESSVKDSDIALWTSGTMDSPIPRPKRQPVQSKSHGHAVLVRNDSYYSRRLTSRPYSQRPTSLISSVIDQQKAYDGKVLAKSNSWGEINATRNEPLDKKPEVMKIKCDICNEEFLDNKDQILYCFPNYCDMCRKMHNDLFMKNVDRSEIYTSYEMEVTYLVAKHAHEGECENPSSCKIEFYEEKKLLPLLRYFNKRDRDLKDNGKVKDLYDERMKYYRRPIEYNCKCDHCVTFYIIVSARIVKS